MSNSHWRTGDLLDLHYLLERDRQGTVEDESKLALRDRAIYQDITSSLPDPAVQPDDRGLLKCWLEKRYRQLEQEKAGEVLPGKIWGELQAVLLMCGFGGGNLLGLAICLPYFTYTGTAPLNVTLYFAIFVFLQFLLAGIQGGVLCFNLFQGMRPPRAFLAGLAVRTVMRGISLFNKRFFRGEGSSLGPLCRGVEYLQHHRGYTALSLWSGFVFLQLVGIGFNLGVIMTTLVKVSVSDMAFGWQSTLQIQEQVLAEAVRWIAMPWSWLLPEQVAFPGLDAISGSRIILKDGIRHLATEDLVTWWPFLCLSVFCYGLIPRFLLLIVGLYRRKKELHRLPVTDLDVAALLRRMKTASLEIETLKVTEDKSISKDAEPVVSPEELLVDTQAALEREAVTIVLIPAELDNDFTIGELTDQCFAVNLKEADPVNLLFFGELEEEDNEMISSLQSIAAPEKEVRLYLLQEGWQPPIEESLELLRTIRRVLGEETVITMILTGKPRPDTIFTSASEEQLQIWRMKFQVLRDPNLEIISCKQ